MKKIKGYYAPFNTVGILFLILIILLTYNASIGFRLFIFSAFLIQYLALFHSSVIFYDHKMQINIGYMYYDFKYSEVNGIQVEEWVLPFRKSNGDNMAHVFYITGHSPIGLNHSVFTEEMALEIVGTFKRFKNSGEVYSKIW